MEMVVERPCEMGLLEATHGLLLTLHSTHQPVAVLNPLPRGLRVLFLAPGFSTTCILMLGLGNLQ